MTVMDRFSKMVVLVPLQSMDVDAITDNVVEEGISEGVHIVSQ